MSRGLRRRVGAWRCLFAGLLAVAMLPVLSLAPPLASAGTRSPSGDASAFALQRMAEAPSARGRWDPCTVIGYRVNTVLAGPGAVRDVREAVRRLSAATGLTFAYRGRTTLVPQADWGRADYPADTQVIVAWVRPARTTLWPEGSFSVNGRDVVAGTGGAWHVQATDSSGRLWGRYTRGFVLLNAGVTLPAGFAAAGPSGPRGREIMHELGHLVGLDHPRLADPDQVMYPELTSRPGRWGNGDLTGLRRVGAGGGCLHDL
jgi:hypothetical protein